MYQNHWRNPYAVKRRKPSALQRPASKNIEILPPKPDTKTVKHSLVKAREQVRSVREQLQQMENTIETLFTVMDAVERFGTSGKKGAGSQTNLLKTFQNIDFKQVMNFLQSPLIQALVETMAEEEPPKKKS